MFSDGMHRHGISANHILSPFYTCTIRLQHLGTGSWDSNPRQTQYWVWWNTTTTAICISANRIRRVLYYSMHLLLLLVAKRLRTSESLKEWPSSLTHKPLNAEKKKRLTCKRLVKARGTHHFSWRPDVQFSWITKNWSLERILLQRLRKFGVTFQHAELLPSLTHSVALLSWFPVHCVIFNFCLPVFVFLLWWSTKEE